MTELESNDFCPQGGETNQSVRRNLGGGSLVDIGDICVVTHAGVYHIGTLQNLIAPSPWPYWMMKREFDVAFSTKMNKPISLVKLNHSCGYYAPYF